jgi:hypothetical protein
LSNCLLCLEALLQPFGVPGFSQKRCCPLEALIRDRVLATSRMQLPQLLVALLNGKDLTQLFCQGDRLPDCGECIVDTALLGSKVRQSEQEVASHMLRSTIGTMLKRGSQVLIGAI